MISWLGRRLTGNPCIGCNVRDQALSPEGVAENNDNNYILSVNHDNVQFRARRVAETCIKTFEGRELQTEDRFNLCEGRFADPLVTLRAMNIIMASRQEYPTE